MTLPIVNKPEDLNELKLSEMIAWFNANVAVETQKVKTFRTKTIAKNACIGLLERAEEQRLIDEKYGHLSDEEFANEMLKEIDEVSSAGKRDAFGKPSLILPMSDEVRKALAKEAGEKGANSASVKRSWQNDDIHNARTMRNHVYVTYPSHGQSVKEEFRSVREAFERLALPMSRHIRFRTQLKKIGAKCFEWDGDRYHFEVIERSR